MKINSRVFAQLSLTALLFSAAGCLSTPAAFDPNETFDAGQMTATIGVNAVRPAYVHTQVITGGYVDVVGTESNGHILTLHLGPDATGGVLAIDSKTNSYVSYQQSSTLLWITDPLQSSGNITITSRSNKRITGTFEAEMIVLNSNDHRNPLHVVSGVFDVQY